MGAEGKCFVHFGYLCNFSFYLALALIIPTLDLIIVFVGIVAVFPNYNSEHLVQFWSEQGGPHVLYF